MTLVLDVGSGASLPDIKTAERFVDAIKVVDSGKHKIVLKAQLFVSAPPNTPLDPDVFRAIYRYGKEQGYEVTASVFDRVSLEDLLEYTIPFVKIACRPDLYWLAGEVPRRMPVWYSWGMYPPKMIGRGEIGTYCDDEGPIGDVEVWCVPRYPADVDAYGRPYPDAALSDHTVGWDLYRLWSPRIIEKHLSLPDTTGPDAGPWAVTPEQLQEIM